VLLREKIITNLISVSLLSCSSLRKITPSTKCFDNLSMLLKTIVKTCLSVKGLSALSEVVDFVLGQVEIFVEHAEADFVPVLQETFPGFENAPQLRLTKNNIELQLLAVRQCVQNLMNHHRNNGLDINEQRILSEITRLLKSLS